jgi:hypothetical protein
MNHFVLLVKLFGGSSLFRPRYVFTSLLIGLFVLGSLSLKAQNETDEFPLLEIKDGIGFHKDSVFLMNLRFRMQNRAAYFSQLDQGTEPGFEARVRRLRLRLDGYLMSPKLSYYIQLSFSRADQDLVDDNIAQTVRDAMIYYKFTPTFYIGFGQSKLPGNRQRVVSSGNIQMPDRSIANQLYTLDRDFGIFAYKTLPYGERGQLLIKAALSSGEGRNAVFSNNGLAYTARMEWLPMGKFKNSGDYSEGDLEFEPSPKLSLAGGYMLNQRAVRRGGQLGKPLPVPVDMRTFIGDMMFKYNGWAVLGEFFHRRLGDLPASSFNDELLAGIPSGEAYHLQASRMLGRKSELIVRYAYARPEASKAGIQPHLQTKAIGYTRYLNGHRIKIQTYLGLDDRTYEGLSSQPQSSYTNRAQAIIQMELGI